MARGKRVNRVVPTLMKPEGCMTWRKHVSRVAPMWMKPEGCVT